METTQVNNLAPVPAPILESSSIRPQRLAESAGASRPVVGVARSCSESVGVARSRLGPLGGSRSGSDPAEVARISSEWLGAAWSGSERLGATRSDSSNSEQFGATRALRASRAARPTLEAPIYLSARTIEQIRSIRREQLSSSVGPRKPLWREPGELHLSVN